jgi:hypothetical protein
MITIRQTGLPVCGAHWSYGERYMREISADSARKLCGMYPTPRMGYETIVGIRGDGYGGKYRLCVQNISGAFFLASSSVPVAQWPEVFEVKVVEPSRGIADDKRTCLA